MCCLATVMALLGPRVAIIVWWIADPGFVRDAFTHLFWLIAAILFAPWTAVFYLIAFISGGTVSGWEWFLIALGIMLDLASYSGGAWGNRNRFSK